MLLLNENAPIDFALNLLGGGVVIMLIIGLIKYLTPKSAPYNNPISPPKTQSEKLLWVILWGMGAVLIYYAYILISAFAG